MSDLRQKVEEAALRYHKATDGTGEGEYGCPGLECPGVKRLADFWTPVVSALSAPETPPTRQKLTTEQVVEIIDRAKLEQAMAVQRGNAFRLEVYVARETERALEPETQPAPLVKQRIVEDMGVLGEGYGMGFADALRLTPEEREQALREAEALPPEGAQEGCGCDWRVSPLGCPHCRPATPDDVLTRTRSMLSDTQAAAARLAQEKHDLREQVDALAADGDRAAG